MDSGDLTTGRYLYWEESVQRSFEIVHQESQSQLIFSQVLDGVAASGVLKRIDSQRWEASVTGRSMTQWMLVAAAASDALQLERSDGFKALARRMLQSPEWQKVVGQPVDPQQTLLIQAAPGSGKSTLLREWCRGRPNNKILLLAFNKAVAKQLEDNFKSELPNVTVQTIHSLAHHATSHLHQGNIGDPTKTDLKEFLQCSWNEVEKQQELLRQFCASASSRLSGRDGSRELHLHKTLWTHFASGNCHFRVPHNVYLKLFQLSPGLQEEAFQGYEIVVLDEAQDCTDCMLDLLSRGKFARVIACDPHQNIYQFNNVDGRYLAKMGVNYRMSLPQSFRFGNDIAQLLTRIARTSPAPADPTFQVRGMPELQTSLEVVEDPSRAIQKLLGENKKMTVLARKNSSLFFEAMNVIASLGENKSISFIGGFESFSENHLVPVMDLFYLGQGCTDQIQSKFRNYLTNFPSLESLRSKCEREQDMEWLPKFTIYDKLRGQMMGPEKLEALIRDIEEQVIPSQQADVVFSTVHQAKGLGFQNVVLLEDYLDEATQEEYNIFYVACSRVSTGSLFVAKSSMQALDGPRGRKRGREAQDLDFDYLDFLDDDLFPDDFLESFPEENLPEDFPEHPEDFPDTFEHYTLEEEDTQEGEEEEQCFEDDCFDD